MKKLFAICIGITVLLFNSAIAGTERYTNQKFEIQLTDNGSGNSILRVWKKYNGIRKNDSDITISDGSCFSNEADKVRRCNFDDGKRFYQFIKGNREAMIAFLGEKLGKKADAIFAYGDGTVAQETLPLYKK